MIIYARDNTDNKISNTSVVWISDVFTKNDLDNFLKGQTPLYIVNDHFTAIDIPNQKIYSAPLWLAKEIQCILEAPQPTTSYQTDHIFNFMINKKSVNRFLCIKFVEMFKLQNYNYTWSGIGRQFDMIDILNELNLLGNNSPIVGSERSFLLSEIKIPSKVFQHSNDKVIPDVGIDYSSNSDIWHSYLYKLFSTSAISLITESLSFQKGTVFTEKTAFAVLGKTFPIWVGGGLRHAEQFKEMGFDVFDDVVDHSYQYYDTLIERCYYAFKKNLRILTDFEYIKKMRQEHMLRLEKNQQLIKSKQIDNFCKQQISQWPFDLQHAIDNEIKKWI